VRKKTFLTAGFISVLFLIAIAEACFVKFAQANPYIDHKFVAAPVHPIITILSPENNIVYASNNLTLNFNSIIDNRSNYRYFQVSIKNVYYQTSWQADNITLYRWSDNDPLNLNDDDPFINEYSRKLSLTGIPDGKQYVTVMVTGAGSYADGAIWCSFGTGGSETVSFVTDTTPPNVSILQMENATYTEPEFPLNFTVNEAVSQVTYSLDGQENVTIAGNTTLTNLPYGEHNVTVYATDNVGNIGFETVIFTIAEPEPEPFPATMVIAPSASVAIVGAGLLVYFKKRKH
jgi:hypothetical protein